MDGNDRKMVELSSQCGLGNSLMCRLIPYLLTSLSPPLFVLCVLHVFFQAIVDYGVYYLAKQWVETFNELTKDPLQGVNHK